MKKSEKYAYIGTAISVLIILLILLLVFLPGIKREEDEGVMISFGDVMDGAGSEQLHSNQAAEQTLPTPQMERPDELITQTDKSVVIPVSKTKTEVIKPADPVTPKTPTRPQPNAQPNREEQLKREQQASQQADELMSAFGGGNTGSGNTQTANTAGNPIGQGTSGGNSWSLTGRNLLGDLVKPIYTEDQSGEVTLRIRVDINGRVTSAVYFKGRRATNELIKAAQQAAFNTRFTPGDVDVVGTITYNFNLK